MKTDELQKKLYEITQFIHDNDLAFCDEFLKDLGLKHFDAVYFSGSLTIVLYDFKMLHVTIDTQKVLEWVDKEFKELCDEDTSTYCQNCFKYDASMQIGDGEYVCSKCYTELTPC